MCSLKGQIGPKYYTIQKLNFFFPYKYWPCPVFRSPLWDIKKTPGSLSSNPNQIFLDKEVKTFPCSQIILKFIIIIIFKHYGLFFRMHGQMLRWVESMQMSGYHTQDVLQSCLIDVRYHTQDVLQSCLIDVRLPLQATCLQWLDRIFTWTLQATST